MNIPKKDVEYKGNSDGSNLLRVKYIDQYVSYLMLII